MNCKQIKKQLSNNLGCWPGGCPQSSDPGLEDSQEESEGVFSDNDKVDARQEDSSMDDEANNDSDHVHSQLPGHHLQVLDGDDLTTDETGNTEGRVPEEVKKLLLFHKILALNKDDKEFVRAQIPLRIKRS